MAFIKRFYAAISLLVFTVFMCVLLASNKIVPEGILQKQVDANEQYNRLLKSFDGEYPDYYSGAYIGKDNTLVVQVYDINDAIKKELVEISCNPMLSIERVPYSMNRLLSLYNYLLDLAISNKQLDGLIHYIAIDEAYNLVEIGAVDIRKVTSILFDDIGLSVDYPIRIVESKEALEPLAAETEFGFKLSIKLRCKEAVPI